MELDNKKLENNEISKEDLDNVSGGYIARFKKNPGAFKRNPYVVVPDDTGAPPDWIKYPTKKEAQKAAAAQGHSTKELNFKKWGELFQGGKKLK